MNARFVPFIFAGLAVLCLVAMGTIAKAQEPPTGKCLPRDDLVKMLGDKYHEVPIAIGMVNEGLIMEAFSSPQGTWTIFLTNTKKVSCMVMDGGEWAFDTSAFDAAKKGEAM